MKKNSLISIITCFLTIGILFVSCKSPDSNDLTEADRQYFEEATAKAQDGWNSGDREPYVNRYSTDAIFMAPNLETIHGKEAIHTFATSFPDVNVKFTTVEITGAANYAYVRGTFVVSDSTGAILDKGKYASLWEKSADDMWQLTRDIFNSDLPVTAVSEESGHGQQTLPR